MLKKNASYSFFKIATIVLLCLCLTTIGYLVFMHNENMETERILKTEKQQIITDLKKANERLDVAIRENTDLKLDLVLEKNKITGLLDQIRNTDVNLKAILKYKREIERLNQVVFALKKDKLQLIKSNQEYKNQRDSTIMILGSAIKFSDTLIKKNIDLKKEIKKENTISVYNLKVFPINISKKGNVLHTVNANKVNSLRINFMVSGNNFAEPCVKKYYIQVIDFDGNVFGEKLVKKFDNSILFYNVASTEVNFVNKNVDVIQVIPGRDFKKGTYFVNIFDQDELVSKASFTLI